MGTGKSILNKLFVLILTLVLAFWMLLPSKEQGLKMDDLPALPRLEVLDLVLRAGVDLDSLLISRLSNSPYSHIGVVISTKPLQILHASSTDTQNKVAISEWSDFLAHAKALAIKRYVNLAHKERVMAHLKAQVGKEFRLTNDETRLYCTTLIEDAFKQGLNLNLAYEKLDLSLLSGKYLFPKAFYEDNASLLLYEFKR